MIKILDHKPLWFERGVRPVVFIWQLRADLNCDRGCLHPLRDWDRILPKYQHPILLRKEHKFGSKAIGELSKNHSLLGSKHARRM